MTRLIRSILVTALLSILVLSSSTLHADDASTYRGKIVLIVEQKTIAQDAQLSVGIDQLVQDLIGDGWRVLRHDVDRGPELPTYPAGRPPLQGTVNAFADWESQNAPRVRE